MRSRLSAASSPQIVTETGRRIPMMLTGLKIARPSDTIRRDHQKLGRALESLDAKSAAIERDNSSRPRYRIGQELW